MDELTRTRYLQALGTDSYISRRQLPGAAATRRLAIVQSSPRPLPQAVPALAESVARGPSVPVKMPRLEADSAVAAPEAAPGRPVDLKRNDPEFSLVAIHCGGWLWLEEQGDAGLLSEQLLLVQSMAVALGMTKGDADKRASSARFDWPIHKNRQLDQGEDAARSSVAGFIQRKLEQLCCQGLVLLGRECEGRLALDQLDCARVARTVSTAQMLRNPLLKQQAWRDLHPVSQQT
tara:strand:+ start:9660 stop:10361 length:702 start_codon:yes stop_codon:yes gene_type:complete